MTKNEYEQKLQNELENLKNNILINTDDESKKYMEDKKEIENEYYSEINRIKKDTKENQKKLEETLITLFLQRTARTGRPKARLPSSK